MNYDEGATEHFALNRDPWSDKTYALCGWNVFFISRIKYIYTYFNTSLGNTFILSIIFKTIFSRTTPTACYWRVRGRGRKGRRKVPILIGGWSPCGQGISLVSPPRSLWKFQQILGVELRGWESWGERLWIHTLSNWIWLILGPSVWLPLPTPFSFMSDRSDEEGLRWGEFSKRFFWFHFKYTAGWNYWVAQLDRMW